MFIYTDTYRAVYIHRYLPSCLDTQILTELFIYTDTHRAELPMFCTTADFRFREISSVPTVGPFRWIEFGTFRSDPVALVQSSR